MAAPFKRLPVTLTYLLTVFSKLIAVYGIPVPRRVVTIGPGTPSVGLPTYVRIRADHHLRGDVPLALGQRPIERRGQRGRPPTERHRRDSAASDRALKCARTRAAGSAVR